MQIKITMKECTLINLKLKRLGKPTVDKDVAQTLRHCYGNEHLCNMLQQRVPPTKIEKYAEM